jgi:hypothetical protein
MVKKDLFSKSKTGNKTPFEFNFVFEFEFIFEFVSVKLRNIF